MWNKFEGRILETYANFMGLWPHESVDEVNNGGCPLVAVYKVCVYVVPVCGWKTDTIERRIDFRQWPVSAGFEPGAWPTLERLQSAYSHKVRLVLISAYAITNHDVMLQ